MKNWAWWQSAVIYQIYPRSFQDSNGDGVGDLPGIANRLDYLKELGIDAIWLSPIFKSPMADFGYDIADYKAVDPIFGALQDLDHLIEAAHAAGLKIILDLVPNHTSDLHPWFQESRSSKSNAKRAWYIWCDPASDGGPPNNWLSEFGGSAWTYDDTTGQYYYHAFLAAQPDLNWRNPEVRAAIYDVMRFWFQRGVDGFRIDVIWHLAKDAAFRDNPPNPDFKIGDPPHLAFLPIYSTDRPEVHDIIAEMRTVADAFEGRLLIGEIYLPISRLVAYYGRDLKGLHLPFNFSLLSATWQANSLASLIDEYEAALPLGGWPNWVLGNHDRPRIASRIGSDQAKIAAILLLTLRGTPTIYYGDEIGLEQAAIERDKMRDPAGLNLPGHALGRDGCRTPMQWNGAPNAGFTKGRAWLPLSRDYAQRNVERESVDRHSIYQLYRRLIQLRATRPSLRFGEYRLVAVEDDQMRYIREFGDERILVALNLGGETRRVDLPSASAQACILVATDPDRDGRSISRNFELRPNEGLVIELA